MDRNLSELKIGAKGCIADLQGEADMVQRLLELGLTEGEQIEVLRFAPLGDPIEIRVRGYNLSLRRAEARCVLIEPLP